MEHAQTVMIATCHLPLSSSSILLSLSGDEILRAEQSFLGRSVHSRQPRLLKRLAVPDHLGNTLGGEEDDGHTVPVEAGQDVLIGPVRDRANVRLEISGVAHYYRNGSRVSPGEEAIHPQLS